MHANSECHKVKPFSKLHALSFISVGFRVTVMYVLGKMLECLLTDRNQADGTPAPSTCSTFPEGLWDDLVHCSPWQTSHLSTHSLAVSFMRVGVIIFPLNVPNVYAFYTRISYPNSLIRYSQKAA